MWMPDFYRKNGFYIAADGQDIAGLDPPSSTFPEIPRPILEDITERVRVIRNDGGKLVEVIKVDPVNQTFYFAEAVGDVDMNELEVCTRSVFRTIHTNNWSFKPSIEEIALQVPPEMWGVTHFVQCDRLVKDGKEMSWPPNYLVDPTSGQGIYPNRLHLATTTLFLAPEDN